MPDFDVDFCMNRRGEVIQYVQEKYGKTQVGQIVTMHQLKARGVVRDIARAMEIPFGEADKLAKLVPEPVQGKSPPVREAIEQVAELKQLYNESPMHRELLDLRRVARRPQPQRRHARGRHRDRREAAVGVRAVLSRPERRARHAVRDEGGRGGRTPQVRLPGPQDAHGDPDRGEADQSAAPADGRRRVRHQPDQSRGSRRLQNDRAWRHDRRVPARVERLPRNAEEAQARLPRGYRRGRRAVSTRPCSKAAMVDQYIEVKHGRKTADYMHPSLEGVLKRSPMASSSTRSR